MVRQIMNETGVKHIHLSQNDRGVVDRTVTVTGDMCSLQKAYKFIAELLRSEGGLRDGARETVRLLVPDAASIVGEMAISQLRKLSGSVHISRVQQGGKEKLITCSGSPEQTLPVVLRVVETIAKRNHARHKDFLSQWAFETCYNDHFESPTQAYTDILPVLLAISLQKWRARHHRKRKRAEELGLAQLALAELVLYDPYYCKGSMRAALVSLGLCAERCINQNRDFYRCAPM